MKQTQLIRAARRYWWLLVVIPLISTIATYGFFSLQPRTYQAVSTLLIRGPALSQEGGLPLSTQETLNTYAFLITQEPVLAAVIDKLHLGYSPEDLAQQVNVQLQTNTGLLNVYVVDSDPDRAAAIDNAIDDAFIAQISARLEAEAATQEAAYQTQIDAIQSDIDRLTSEIATLSVKAPSSETATKLAGDQIQLDSDLTTQTQLRSSLLGLRASTVLKGDEIIVARVAGSGTLVGVASRTDLLAALAGGLILAIAVILTLLLLDSRVTSTQQLAEATGLPTLAAIKAAPKRLRRGQAIGPELVVLNGAPATADYNRLRRSLLQAMSPMGAWSPTKDGCRIVMVTSPVRGQGKSSVAANLAALLARRGYKSVLLDANVEGPDLGEIFGINGHPTHATGVEGNTPPWTSRLPAPGLHPADALKQTKIANLKLMEAGPRANGPTMSTERLIGLLDELTMIGTEFVIVDAPPLRASDETADLSARADAVILVVAAGRTSEGEVREGIEAVRAAGGNVIGAVLTGVESSHEAFRYA